MSSGTAGGAGSVSRSGPQHDDGSETSHVQSAAVRRIPGPHAAGRIRAHAGPQLSRHDRANGAETRLPHAPHAGQTGTQAHRGPQPTQYSETAASTQATSTAGRVYTVTESVEKCFLLFK